MMEFLIILLMPLMLLLKDKRRNKTLRINLFWYLCFNTLRDVMITSFPKKRIYRITIYRSFSSSLFPANNILLALINDYNVEIGYRNCMSTDSSLLTRG